MNKPSTPCRRWRARWLFVGVALLAVFRGQLQLAASPLKLWYSGTASAPLTQGLLLGNGRMGGIVMGTPAADTVYLNENSLWTGDANTSGNYSGGFGSYQYLGTLALNLPGNSSYTNFRRELDIGDSLATVTYTSGGVDYTREYFASHPDQVIAIRLTASAAGSHTGTLVFTDSHGGTLTGSGNAVIVSGSLSNGIKYGAKIVVLNTGGSVSASGGTITFTGCDSLTVLLAFGSNYVMDSTQNWQGPDPAAVIAAQANAAAAKSYATLKSAHQDDFHALFNRTTLDVGTTSATISALPTDQRISYAAAGNDPDLEELLYQYGRYLLISCSRPGGLPANLQGLWNISNSPPWFSDYHTNINIQMNYWGAEVSNLSECHQPLLNLIQSQLPIWRQRTADLPAASKPNGTPRGWTVRTSHNITGGMGWNWNVSGNAWYALHFWEHYAFTGDLGYLQNVAYPVLKEVCQYWQDDLKTSGTSLVVPYGWSPEHGPWEDGTSYDQELVWNVFNNYIKASQILGIDADFRTTITQLRDQLYKPIVGTWGQLTEWMNPGTEATYATNPELFRHTNHLVGLYPACEMTPDLDVTRADAAQVSLIAHGETGDSQSEWAAAWRTGLWSRLRNGDMARHWLDLYFTWGCNPNLVGNLSGTPQWDGSFGFAGTIPEMLLQSHAGFLDLLPALPSAWPSGSVTGLRARGGFIVDMNWQNNFLTSATIHSQSGNSFGNFCRLRYGSQFVNMIIPPGSSMSYVPPLTDVNFGNRTAGGIATASAQVGGNAASNVVDGSASTVWTSGSSGGSAWLQYQFGGGAGWAITQYKLVSGTSGTTKSPRDWQLLGSNDGTNWTTLDTQSGETFSAAGQVNRYRFSNAVPYFYYRLNVTATAGGASGVELAEFQLWSLNGAPAASASNEYSPNETSAHAFDGSTSTKWYNTGVAPPGWISYRFGNAAGWAVTEYRLTSANDVQQRDLKDWQFQGSNDATNWTTLDTRSGETFGSRYLTKTYTLSNTTPWRYYRLNVTANYGGSGYGLQLSEFLLKTSVVLSATPGDSQVVLGWTPAAGAASYNLKRSASQSGTFTTISSGTNALTYSDTGMTNGTTMYYKIAPVFSGTEGPESAIVSATPAGSSSVKPPSTPQSLVATGGGSQMTLTWSAQSGATTYRLWRSPATGGVFQIIADGITATNYSDTGLPDGATYYYLLAATGPGGTSDSTDPVLATTYTAQENWRFANFGTTSNSGNAADSADPDGDGWTNAQEFASGTNPNDPTSLLKVNQMQSSGNDMVVSFRTVSGKTYRLERSDTLLSGSWVTVQDNIAGTGGIVQVSDTGGALQPKRFYRLVVLP